MKDNGTRSLRRNPRSSHFRNWCNKTPTWVAICAVALVSSLGVLGQEPEFLARTPFQMVVPSCDSQYLQAFSSAVSRQQYIEPTNLFSDSSLLGKTEHALGLEPGTLKPHITVSTVGGDRYELTVAAASPKDAANITDRLLHFQEEQQRFGLLQRAEQWIWQIDMDIADVQKTLSRVEMQSKKGNDVSLKIAESPEFRALQDQLYDLHRARLLISLPSGLLHIPLARAVFQPTTISRVEAKEALGE